MRHARLGRTDLDISVLGLGCGNFGGIGSAPELFGRGEDERTAFALMDAARDAGITLFDTANSYGGGTSEEWVGRWLAGRAGARDEIVLTTKVRNRMPDGGEGLSPAEIAVAAVPTVRGKADPFGTSAAMPLHPRCRCTSLPRLKTWKDLLGLDMPEGFDDGARGVRDADGNWVTAKVEDFEDWRQRRGAELGVAA